MSGLLQVSSPGFMTAYLGICIGTAYKLMTYDFYEVCMKLCITQNYQLAPSLWGFHGNWSLRC